MVQELKDQFIETEPVEQQAFFWTAMYYYMAKEAIERHGLEGERVIRQAIRDYGRERGRRRRNRVLQKGLDINLVSLFTNGDLNGDTRFQSDEEKSVLTKETRRHFVTRCPDAEMWGRLGGLDIGKIYCEEVHHYLYGCFDDAVQVNLCETLTNGGDICRFHINLREANKKPQEEDHYVPQCWEDCEPDGIACNATMFSLFYYHLASAIRNKLDEETVIAAIEKFAEQRGLRLRELERRNERTPSAASLVENGDLFLDPRCRKTVEQTDNGVTVKVKRCVFAEVCKCHDAVKEGNLYCERIYQGICSAYCPGMKAEVKSCLCSSGECEIQFLENK